MGLQDNNGNKKTMSASMIVFMLLTIGGVILTLVGQIGWAPVARIVVLLLGYVLVAFYALYGYKKPHGNLLRYVMLCFSVLLMLGQLSVSNFDPGKADKLPKLKAAIAQFASGKDGVPKGALVARTLDMLLVGLAIILIAYMSGRLQKYAKNKILSVVILVLLAVRCLLAIKVTPVLIGCLNELIVWIVLVYAYFARYHEHKEAGLEDA